MASGLGCAMQALIVGGVYGNCEALRTRGLRAESGAVALGGTRRSDHLFASSLSPRSADRVFCLLFSSGGGSTAGNPTDFIQSSRAHRRGMVQMLVLPVLRPPHGLPQRFALFPVRLLRNLPDELPNSRGLLFPLLSHISLPRAAQLRDSRLAIHFHRFQE
jgi:hypothetical protein